VRAVVAAGPVVRPGVAFAIEPILSVDRLAHEWQLLEREVAPSFFGSWHWIGTLLDVLPAESRPRLLRGTAAGATVALGLLGDARIHRHRVISARRWVLNATGDPAADSIHVEHNGLLADPEMGWEGLLDAFVAAKDVDELCLSGIARPPSDALLAQRGLRRREACETSYAVELDALVGSSGDVAAILSKNARSQLRRSVRKLEPLRLQAATTEREALAYFGTLKELHVRWWLRRGVRHAFTHSFFERFHERLIERAFASGAIQLLRVSSGDRIVGVLYNFVYRDRVYAYQSGFVHPLPGERPGVVSHALAIRHAWQQGARVYDFMAGENRLKSSFGNDVQTLSWTVVQKPRMRFRLERVLERAAGQATEARHS
jgi:CelD/BcsL family acetyltransferase involved in cellulose biosynthesis